ncbi:hypothetical protein GCM10028825_10960 [Spirosoma agri]
MYGLCLVMLTYACRNEDAEPLKPFSFDALKNLHLPNAKVSAPPPVNVTPSTITESARASQLRAALASAQSGTVDGIIPQAAGDMANALSSTGATPTGFSSSFSPAVLSALTSTGALPAGLQGTVNALIASPSLQPYLIAYTFPQVNGQFVYPTTTSVVGPGTVSVIAPPIVVFPINYTGDACFKRANDAFDSAINNLENERKNQVATADATYSSAKSAAEGDVQGCLSGNLSKYSGLIATARQNLNATIGNLNGARLTIGDTNYNLLTALAYTIYSQQVQAYFNLQLADINTCSITSTLKVASAKFARDTDVNSINDAFNTTVKQAQVIALGLYDACHNQGSGS